MRKILLRGCFTLSLLSCCLGLSSASDLYTVYQDALVNDPTFQQAAATQRSIDENLPIAFSLLLPSVDLNGTTGVSHTSSAGAQTTLPNGKSDATNRSYNLQLMLTQPLINMAAWSALAQARIDTKLAAANYAAAAQDLMLRVASAYFDVLLAQDNFRYTQSKQLFLQRNLEQAQQRFNVGLNTVTDVNLAQASYSAAVAATVAAENALATKREELRAISNRDYSVLAVLKNDFPLVAPVPADINAWVNVAIHENWSVKAAEFSVQASRENIKIQRSGHWPTLNLQAGYEQDYNYSTSIGSAKNFTPQAGLSLNVPLFQGGKIVAKTRQAIADFEVADQQKEYVLRGTISEVRSDYLSVLAEIAQIKADKVAIQASTSALEGMEAGYRLGTQTMVDVLSAQDQLFNNQTTFARDCYQYMMATLQLKQASGALSPADLQALSQWLQ